MVKLRNRILHAVLLAALGVTMLGTTAEATRRNTRPTSVTQPRPIAAPNSGEPDLTGQTVPAPPKITGVAKQPFTGEAGDMSYEQWVRSWLSQFLKRRL